MQEWEQIIQIASLLIFSCLFRILYMQSIFATKQIVWAKVKGYPWWPAQITKLPTPDHNVFKVVFIAQDSHAFLHPRDVRKYGQFYDQCSKKKMRGLAPAIQAADDLYKKKIQTSSKNNRSPQKSKTRSQKSKKIKKASTPTKNDNNQQSSDGQEQLQQIAEQQISQHLQANGKLQRYQGQQQKQQESIQNEQNESEQQSLDEKLMNEGEQRVDRGKIDSIEQLIYRYIQQIKQSSYKFTIQHYKSLMICNLTDEQLLQSKITNMLNFIIHSLKKQYNFQDNQKDTHPTKQKQQLKQLILLQKQLKQKILHYLNDTTYYDQYLKLIQRNKRNRNDYQNRLIYYLKTSYKIKKELALIFANRLMTQINNGALVRQKELLEDIKEKRVQILNISNKAAIDRCIENMIPKYM